MLLRIGLALIGIAVVAGVASALIWGWDGPDHDRTVEYRVVNQTGSGQDAQPGVVVVQEEGWRRHGFFPFFPLLVVGGVLVVVGLVKRGGPPGGGGRYGRFEEWHRDAHRGDRAEAPPSGS